MWGDEPVVEKIVSLEGAEVARILSWFNYFYDKEKGKKWVLSYMKKKDWDNKRIEYFEKATIDDCSPVMPALARMFVRGTDIATDILSRLDNWIMKYAKHEEPDPIIISLFGQRTDRKLKKVIADLDDCLDEFSFNDYMKEPEKSFYEILQENNIRAAQVKSIKDYFVPYLEEIENSDHDVDLDYAYRHLSKKQKNNFIVYIKKLLDDLDRIATNESVTRVRKPRKAKPIDRSQIVKNVKYMKEDKELKLVSVKPESIIGTFQVWLYSTKYKILRRLETNDPKGLSIRGTTVVDYVDSLSRSKSVRKPKQVLGEILTGNKARLKKIFEEFKGADYPLTGRINDDTIILRTVK